MFNISFSELGIVLLVAVLMLNPRDIMEAIRTLRSFSSKIHHLWWNQKIQLPYDIEIITQNIDQNQANISTRYIIDMEGNPQVAYSIKDVQSQLDKSK